MELISSTDARRNWSELIDRAVRQKPQFIKRTRDSLVLSDVKFIEDLLYGYTYDADVFHETDGSVTLSLRQMDLVENAASLKAARERMAASILEYADEYYADMAYWHSAGNRREHLPYVMKALALRDTEEIGASLVCHDGKN